MDFASSKKFTLYIDLSYTELCFLQTLLERGIKISPSEEKSLISFGKDLVQKVGTSKF